MGSPDLRERLLAHWLKYMPIQPAYIADQIKQHFARAPWDRDAMKPALDAAWNRIKGERK